MDSKNTHKLTRRTFLAAAGGAVAALAMPGLSGHRQTAALAQAPTPPPDPEWAFGQPHPAKLDLWGRITDSGMPYFDQPGAEAKVIGFLAINKVVPLFEVIHAAGPKLHHNTHNDVWYRMSGGYLYTSGVQLIAPYHMPTEITAVTTQIDEMPGFWAEVIVPLTTARNAPSGAPVATDNGENVILNYSSVHRVIEVKPETISRSRRSSSCPWQR